MMWEYKTCRYFYDEGTNKSILQTAGREGWELVQVVVHPASLSGPASLMIFKRPAAIAPQTRTPDATSRD
jgi:hypothetical protein